MLGLCERFGCLPEPGALYDQDTSLLRMARIEHLGRPPDPHTPEA